MKRTEKRAKIKSTGVRDFYIELKDYTLDDLKLFLKDSPVVILSDDVVETVRRSRELLESFIDGQKVIYGVNTGFGKLSQIKIDEKDILTLQQNLIRSHAVGVGAHLPKETVRLVLLLKLLSLAKGYSGIRLELMHHLVAFLNKDLIPLIPMKGSVGASGDLAPLAHLALPIIGEGEASVNGKRMPGRQALAEIGLTPLVLQAKEGISLINGTQVSAALAVAALIRLKNLVKAADIAGALTVDATKGTRVPFGEKVHVLKKHQGQRASASNLDRLVEGSEILQSHENCLRVQDMYSVRCMPQVHGACRDTIAFATQQVMNEVNSVSDNPLIFQESGEIITAGHFHGEAVGLACDAAAMAASELGSISERRTFAMTTGNFGLPAFLVSQPGLNSGFMLVHVTAAALASENKTLAHPATVDNIPTGADQEDHVSMSTWAAVKLTQIVDNLEYILAIELLSAAQAVEFHGGLQVGRGALEAYRLLRDHVPFLDIDRALSTEIGIARELIGSGQVVDAVNKVVPLQ